MKVKQKLEGNNNVQVGINYGEVVHTEKLIRRVEVIHDSNLHISDAEAKLLKDKVDEIVELRSQTEGKEKTYCYKRVYTELYNHFNITSYKLLPKNQFDEAIKWFDKQKAYRYRPKLRKVNNEEYRKQLYKSIHAKANQLGWDNETLYEFINVFLQPKVYITSLKDMSDTRHKKVYNKLFSR